MRKNRLLLVFATCLGTLLCGCSDKGAFKVGKVTGQVTFQGQGVADVMVQLIPKSTGEGGLSGKSAIGTTDANGNFELSTYQLGDGAVIGTHSVKVGSQDPQKGLPGKISDGFTFDVTSGTNDLRIELVPGGGGANRLARR